MAYKERLDKRGFDETRPIEAKVGIIKRADGSAMFKIGNTIAYAAVYGPRNLHPKFMQNPKTGILRCSYNMMPFSGSGNRVRPGGSRRSKEISLVTQKALLPVLNLEEYPNAVVDVFIEFPQTQAGSRCAGICAASMALADAGLVMKDLIAAVSVGRVDDKIVVDITKEEEDYEDGEGPTDIPFTMTSRKHDIVHLQLDGNIPTSRFKEAVDASVIACDKINDYQMRALKGERIDENEGGKK